MAERGGGCCGNGVTEGGGSSWLKVTEKAWWWKFVGIGIRLVTKNRGFIHWVWAQGPRIRADLSL